MKVIKKSVLNGWWHGMQHECLCGQIVELEHNDCWRQNSQVIENECFVYECDNCCRLNAVYRELK